jgi:hypothetical protein
MGETKMTLAELHELSIAEVDGDVVILSTSFLSMWSACS